MGWVGGCAWEGRERVEGGAYEIRSVDVKIINK